MRLIIEARLAEEGSDTGHDDDGALAVIERLDGSLADLGLTLAEGRSLLAKVQAENTLRRCVSEQAFAQARSKLSGDLCSPQ